ncbi:MAG: hypothetical protein B6244_11385 [Candidatus Cloacimonetes bacterium 4572_55]|nr:MAG: hypothetical protein B6244_11385 [Candidatus Cloacimonetes bacterium 4572_55]
MKWRKWNIIIHRDLGYLCFGLTIIYAISGIAVNHIDSWNPSYRIEYVEHQIEPIREEIENKNDLAKVILSRLSVESTYKAAFRPDSETLEIFMEDGSTIRTKYRTGEVEREVVHNRAILHWFNFLHLNKAKKIWTWISDIYALSLAILATTGIFILKGKRGITGRGAWLTAVGFIVPIFFLWLYL